MKLQKNTAKITMTLFITLTLSFLTIGCGSTKPDAAAENTESGAATEAAVAETETETKETVEATEPTEVATEEVTETEEVVIATGYVSTEYETINIVDIPSLFDGWPVCEIYKGDTVKILGEAYNEEEQVDFYKVQNEDGKIGYLPKEDIQLAE